MEGGVYPLVVSEELLTAAGIDPTVEDGWVALPDSTIRGREGDVKHYGSAQRTTSRNSW